MKKIKTNLYSFTEICILMMRTDRTKLIRLSKARRVDLINRIIVLPAEYYVLKPDSAKNRLDCLEFNQYTVNENGEERGCCRALFQTSDIFASDYIDEKEWTILSKIGQYDWMTSGEDREE